MTFDEKLNATKRLLQKRKQLRYGEIQRNFFLEDEDDVLEVVKERMIQDPRVTIDQNGERLLWTDGSE